MKRKDTPLSVRIERDVLEIRVGVDVVKWAAEHMDENNPWNDELNDFKRLWQISDVAEFTKDVRRALLDEGEDGSTMLTELLDKACLEAIEQGSQGVLEFTGTPEGGSES